MLNDRINAVKDFFNVEFIDYGDHRGNYILVSSGAGIGMALMDEFESVRYFLDIDAYRHEYVDWEVIGIILANSDCNGLISAGWFTLDRPHNLLKLSRSFFVNSPSGFFRFYEGHQNESLSDFIDRTKQAQIISNFK